MSGQRRQPAKASRAAAAPGGELVLYETADGGPGLEVRLQRDTIWLDAHQMAAIFERDRTVIVRHIRNIYATGELDRGATCARNAQVAADGKVRQMDLYNLDTAISVGSRANSKRGTQFRMKCGGWGAGVGGRRPGAGDQGAAAWVGGRDG